MPASKATLKRADDKIAEDARVQEAPEKARLDEHISKLAKAAQARSRPAKKGKEASNPSRIA